MDKPLDATAMRDPGQAVARTIEVFYAAFDNRGGKRPALDQLRALFLEGARITRVDGGEVQTWTVDEFIAPRAALLVEGALTGFHEWETSATTETFGVIASRSSFYEKEGVLDHRPYRGSGHKLIQLVGINDEWRISAILWQDFT